MPCRIDPTDDEIERSNRYNSPEETIIREKAWEEERKKRKQLELKEKNRISRILRNEMKKKTLENLAFNSFMTVFLCRAMDVVMTESGFKHIPLELQWWYKEHKYRDNHNDTSIMDKKELAQKLLDLEKYLKVK